VLEANISNSVSNPPPNSTKNHITKTSVAPNEVTFFTLLLHIDWFKDAAGFTICYIKVVWVSLKSPKKFYISIYKCSYVLM
jgi:hypothetical protein